MILDYKNQFSRLQAVTASAASTDVIDQGAAGQAIGSELWLVGRVGTAFTNNDANATLTIALQSDSAEGFNAAVVTHYSVTLALAALTANTTVFKVKVPPGLKRYVRGYYTASAEFSGGTIDLFLTPDVEVR